MFNCYIILAKSCRTLYNLKAEETDKIKQCLIIAFILSFPVFATSQTAINKGGSAADSAFILHVKGNNNSTPVQVCI